MDLYLARPDELLAEDVAHWSALERRAADANVYQSPHFVLPAWRHLSPPPQTQVALVRTAGPSGRRVVAAAALCVERASPQLPWSHLAVYDSRHSFLSTPLVDATHVEEAVGALLGQLTRRYANTAGLLIPRIDARGDVLHALQVHLQRQRLQVHTGNPRERAILRPARSGADTLKPLLGKKYNEIERSRRRLAEMGELQWRCDRDGLSGRDDGSAVSNFLRLEHAGWKGEAGTSLLSNPADAAFFREMTAGFELEGRALFTELRLDGKTIASTSNYVSGDAGFAFKVGWDPAYRKQGPGILNEVEFVRHVASRCADLSVIDSGAAPESFIETLWPERRTLVTAFVPFSVAGELAWFAAQRLRRSARRVLGDAAPRAGVSQDQAEVAN
jgi:CelD/BcsL family acetyltransferase involved in cellulose biosynthesis